MTTEQKYILFTMLEYAEKDYENYLKNHGELYPFTMERHGIVIAYRNIIDVLHLSDEYKHFKQELDAVMPPAERSAAEREGADDDAEG